MKRTLLMIFVLYGDKYDLFVDSNIEENGEYMMLTEDEKKFRNFYESLRDKNDIFYVYFSKGLLHFALESLSRVPREVNIVIIAAALDLEEKNILEKYIARKVLYLENAYPDMVIWDMLFRNNDYSFGWMDVDCFVFDRLLFKDITVLDDDIAVNTVWAGKYQRYQIDEWLGNTFFTFYNKNAMDDIFTKYGYISPKITRFPDKDMGYLDNRSYIDISTEQIEVIKKNFCTFRKNERGYFDTTHLYQIYAIMYGLKICRVRDVDTLHEYYFKGALHLGGCNRIHVYRLDNPRTNTVFKFNMRFSFLILRKYLPILPEYYKEMFDTFLKTLESNGISIDLDNIKNCVRRYMNRNNMDYEIMKFEEIR